MNVLKTFKNETKSNNLPRLFNHQNPTPRTNLTNLSQTVMRPSPARPPPQYQATQFSNTSRSTFVSKSTLMRRRLRSNLLIFFTVLGCAAGVALGSYARTLGLRPAEKAYFGFPGELFLRMLKFAIVPLIASSLVCGMASLRQSQMTSRVLRRAFFYYFATTFLAVVLGLVLVMFIKPGYRVKLETGPASGELPATPLVGRKISPLDTLFDLLRNLFPDNIVQMTFMQYESRMVPKYKRTTHEPARPTTLVLNSTFGTLSNASNQTAHRFVNTTEAVFNLTNQTSGNLMVEATAEPLSVHQPREVDYWYAQPGERHGINVLGLVMFCFVLGHVLPQMKRRGKMIIDLFEAINQASVKIVEIIMILSPVGIGSIICHAVLTMDNPRVVFEKISYYLGTVFLGLFIHGLVVLPLIYILVTKKNIFAFARNMFEALLVAFATSSSNASLPITLKCVEENNRIPRAISRFVLPVGATINMDGTALYEAVAAIFIAQLNNIELRTVDYIVASLTATVASIGAAGIPSSGLVTMIIVLSALNLPQTQISIIYAVDWFLDRFRTTINVWGDAIGTGVVAHLSMADLQMSKEIPSADLDTTSEKKPIPEDLRDPESDDTTECGPNDHNETHGNENEEDGYEEEDEDDDEDDYEEPTMPEELHEEPAKVVVETTGRKQDNDESVEKTVTTGSSHSLQNNSHSNSNSSLIHQQPQVVRINEGFVTDELKNNETTF